MLSRFSQRWTVVTSRPRYSAIVFHESSRFSSGFSEVGVSGDGSLMDLPIVTPKIRHGKRRYLTANRRFFALLLVFTRPSDQSWTQEIFHAQRDLLAAILLCLFSDAAPYYRSPGPDAAPHAIQRSDQRLFARDHRHSDGS